MTDGRKNNKIEDQGKCSTCGKKIAGQADAGSLTSYLFQPFNCSCGRSKSSQSPGAGKQSKSAPSQNVEIEFCTICGLQKIQGGAQGSLTGFLFQDTRCKCSATAQADDNDMAERFWKLRQAGAGTTFSSDAGPGSKKPSAERITIDLLPGSIIGGNYRIGRLIGRGGMGEVYQATHMALNKECALKVIPPDQVTDSSWARFQNEARSIAGLEHVNLVKVTDLGVHEGCLPFYAMEYIKGKSLAELLQAKGPMPLPTVLDVFTQVCDGVDFAHRSGVVHRDLKPANIMLVDAPNGNLTVKILDFGLVKLTRNDRSEQSLTSVGDVFGSPYYMSPEQCLGGKVDNRSDVYSIGCTMFECLAGRPPFAGPTAVEIVNDHQSLDPPSLDSIVGAKVFPESLELVVAKLLRKNPVERYQTLAELRGDLQKVAAGESVQPYYASRTAGNRSSADASENSEHFGTELSKQDKFRLHPKAAVIGILFISGIAASSVFITNKYFRPHESKAKPKLAWTDSIIPAQSTRSEAGRSGRYAELAKTTPFSSIVEENGKKWKVFDFPNEVSIGQIDSYPAGPRGPAKGKFKVPIDDRLMYAPNFIALEFPECLKRFRAGDIEILIVPSDKAATEFEGIDSCLKKMSTVPGVRQLNASNVDGISPDIIAAINGFPSITSLLLSAGRSDTSALGRLTCLPRMTELSLFSFKDISPAIEKLSGSTNMRGLILNGCGITARDLTTISHLSNLDACMIQDWKNANQELVSDFINGLHQLPKLAILQLSVNHYTQKDLKTLGTFKHLTTLNLGGLMADNEDATLAGLAALSPLKITHLDIGKFYLTAKTLQALKTFPKLEAMDLILKHSNLSVKEVRAIVGNTEGFTVEGDTPFAGWCTIRIKR